MWLNTVCSRIVQLIFMIFFMNFFKEDKELQLNLKFSSLEFLMLQVSSELSKSREKSKSKLKDPLGIQPSVY